MTFRQILIMMGGFHDAVAQDLISKGTADGIIQHILEERGIYAPKKTDRQTALCVNHGEERTCE